MDSEISLKTQLLIAMPSLQDPNFARTVTYICEHGEHGAMGIVINRPTDLHLTDILRHMEVGEQMGEAGKQTVFLGGPPALILSAIAPLPEDVPELLLASLLAGGKLRRCPGPVAHPLIAEADFALMGRVPCGARRPLQEARNTRKIFFANLRHISRRARKYLWKCNAGPAPGFRRPR
mgnify:CR=1 FL=1